MHCGLPCYQLPRKAIWCLSVRHAMLVFISRSLSRYQHGTAGSTLKGRWCSLIARRGLGSSRDVLPAWEAADMPIDKASTIPASWYTAGHMLNLELESVFRPSWQVLGHVSQLAAPGDYITGELPGTPYLACRDQRGQLRAFHNVCRHHAAAVASGSGRGAACFRCPYHGWTYALDGRLHKAVGLKGIQDFRASENGLVPLEVATLGPWVFSRIGAVPSDAGSSGEEMQQQQGLESWAGQQGADALLDSGACRKDMVHVARREYSIRCNWKVFVDNYLDGGYHVSVAHPTLAAGLNLDSYSSTIYERLSIQSCQPQGADQRLAGKHAAAYVFIYPNFMINSYGPWIDTNQVIPTGPDSCKVVFQYFLHPSLAGDEGFIAASLAASDQVQQEDIGLCESVQRGLSSPAYDVGRYAPRFEGPMFHFHRLLHSSLQHGC